MTALCSGKICTIFPEKGALNFWKACTIALEYSIISIIVLVYSICRGLWLLCYEIEGYMQGKRCCWYKSMVYIEKCKGGKTKGAYVIENEFFEGELVSDYRRNKINYGEDKFAVLLYFGHHKKVILLQE